MLKFDGSEFVQNVLNSRKEEVSYVGVVHMQLKKGKKPSDVILIIGMNRIFILKSKDGKIVHDYHQLDIVKISFSQKLTLQMKDKEIQLQCSSEQAENIINSIRRTFEFKFSGMPEKYKFQVEAPSSMIQDIIIPSFYLFESSQAR